MMRRTLVSLILGPMIAVGAGCDSTSSQPEITSIPLPPAIDPSDFPQSVASPHPLFPLVEGATARFVGQTPGGEEVTLVEVTDRKKLVQGVTTTVVRDRVWLDGVLVEDTDDWYAQDAEGNVWYFGEDVKNYVDGQVVDRAGSWEAGVDGARAGVYMWAQPRVGTVYYQEYYQGQAEDVGEVLSLNETVDVPYGTFTGCLRTEDTTPLEPDVKEHKYYCPGIGLVLEVNLGDGARVELVEASLP